MLVLEIVHLLIALIDSTLEILLCVQSTFFFAPVVVSRFFDPAVLQLLCKYQKVELRLIRFDLVKISLSTIADTK